MEPEYHNLYRPVWCIYYTKRTLFISCGLFTLTILNDPLPTMLTYLAFVTRLYTCIYTIAKVFMNIMYDKQTEPAFDKYVCMSESSSP